MMIFTIIRGAIEGSPRKLVAVAIVLLAFGTCPTVALFNKYGLVNPLLILFYGIALLVFLLALFKYLGWRRSGLTQPLPNKAVLFQLDHVLSTSERVRPVAGVRETTTRSMTQPVVLIPPSTGIQDVSVACATCQQEAVFRVDSLEERKNRRLRRALISGGLLVVAVILGIVGGSGPAQGDWTSWARIAFLILFLCGTIGLGSLLYYTGARYAKLPPGHKARIPEKADLESFLRTSNLTQSAQ